MQQNLREFTDNLCSLEKSSINQTLAIEEILAEIANLQQKLNRITTKQYQPQLVYSVIQAAHFQHILEFIPFKQQLSLRLISRHFNNQVRINHIELKYNIYGFQQRKLIEGLVHFEENNNRFDETYLQDLNLSQQVQDMNQENFDKLTLSDFKTFRSRHPITFRMTYVFVQFLQYPEALYMNGKDDEVFYQKNIPILFKNKQVFLKKFNSINIYSHPDIEKLEAIFIQNPHYLTEEFGSKTSHVFKSFNNLLLLRAINNKDNFDHRQRLRKQIQTNKDFRQTLQNIYKIKEIKQID